MHMFSKSLFLSTIREARTCEDSAQSMGVLKYGVIFAALYALNG